MLDLIQECTGYTDDISQLDNFLSQLAVQLKERKAGKRTFAIIIYSRRWGLCKFCVTMICHVLNLGNDESVEPSEDINQLASSVLPNSPKTTTNPITTRRCSNPSCSISEGKGNLFKVCGKCKSIGIQIPYCSVACQQKHWAIHKKQCAISPNKS